jgi:hypothetical protein
MFTIFQCLFADAFLVQGAQADALAPSNRLIDLIDAICLLKGSRIHDRVYAIMHLAGDYQEGDIIVDYTKSMGQTMVQAANHHVRLHRNLRFLNRRGQHDWVKTNLELDLVHSTSTWIPRTWLGLSRRPSALSSFQDLYERMLQDEKSVRSNTYVSGFFQDHNEELFNSCSPHCVDVEKMRLRVQGMKVDKVQSLLTGLPYSERISVTQFWTSALGQHIESYMSGAVRKVPLHIVRVLANTWPTVDYSYEDAVNAFAHLFESVRKPGAAHRFIDSSEESRRWIEPLWNINRAVGDALYAILRGIEFFQFILTDRGCFGRLVPCDVRVGDEIWMLLGCSLPVILRKQPDGTYAHICTARIPVLMDNILGHPNIRDFSTESQPGDKFGEWTVQNIELI